MWPAVALLMADSQGGAADIPAPPRAASAAVTWERAQTPAHWHLQVRPSPARPVTFPACNMQAFATQNRDRQVTHWQPDGTAPTCRWRRVAVIVQARARFTHGTRITDKRSRPRRALVQSYGRLGWKRPSPSCTIFNFGHSINKHSGVGCVDGSGSPASGNGRCAVACFRLREESTLCRCRLSPSRCLRGKTRHGGSSPEAKPAAPALAARAGRVCADCALTRHSGVISGD